MSDDVVYNASVHGGFDYYEVIGTMSEIEKIREWQGSKNTAFEELCCQLAAREYTESNGVFRRVRGAGGDGGVEGYWLFLDGTQHGWQTKFFDKVGSSQWNKIDESVEMALSKRSKLIAYTVCLPIDRGEEKSAGKKSMMDHWNAHVARWQQWASDLGMNVDFRYWGEFEIYDRLTRPEHAGRRSFWFNKEDLTDEWMKERLDAALAVAGDRYTPAANITLPIHEVLNGVARTDAFYASIDSLNDKLAEAMRGLDYRHPTQPEIQSALQSVIDAYNSTDREFSRIERGSVRQFDFCSLAPSVTALQSRAEECRHQCEDCIRLYIEKKPDRRPQQISDPQLSELESTSYLLMRVISAGSDILEFAESPCARSANTGALLVLGDAGQGKTHLFCDVASQRLRSGLPTVVLFGEGFNDDEPWLQMAKQLHLPAKTPSEFLGALDALGEARGCRSLIMVDALNETDNRSFWSRYLPDMLVCLGKYKYTALCVSCRSSYEAQVIPSHIVPHPLVSVVHKGFCGEEGLATGIYFRAYGIKEPNIPVLTPEFSNPLFLKLFCNSMKEQGLSDVPSGLRGITAMFNFFVDSIHKRLSKIMDYDSKTNYVSRALTAVADRFAENQLAWLPRDDGKEIVNALLPNIVEYSKTLYRNLVQEGMLVENLHIERDPGTGEWTNIETVRLGFEKFTDHMVVRWLLDKHLDKDHPKLSFKKGKPLGKIFPGEYRVRHVGWLEALSVQIPERLGCELVDLVPRARKWDDLRQPFLKSLVWRDPSKTSKSTDKYLNEVFRHDHKAVYDTLLMLACDPRHTYNAKALHQHLIKLPVSERDYLWSIFLHDYYSEDGPVKRLINWAWCADKSHICDESIELAATALVWYLTSSNRFIRDRATKALVSLMQDRPRVLLRLLPKFADVDDLYVLERFYAVCYGIAMRTKDNKALSELAVYIYNRLFVDNQPTPYILLRDYARGVIEVAAHRNILPSTINLDLVRPPYESEWPLEIPDETEISHYGECHEGMDRMKWAARGIYSSVIGDDFSHYVIDYQANHWLQQRIGETTGPNKQTADEFFSSLTSRQKSAWDKFCTTQSNISLYQRLGAEIWTDMIKGVDISDVLLDENDVEPEALDEHFEKLRSAFLCTLGKQKLAIFMQYVDPYLNHPQGGRLDFQEARRWIIKRAYGLGWTADRFAQFDAFVGSGMIDYRTGRKPERIGKKYQWIAFHEFLAHVADHHLFKANYSDDPAEIYSSPSQIGIRNIDPSLLMRDIQDGRTGDPKTVWWSPVSCHFNEGSLDEKKDWVLHSENMPSPQSLITLADSETGQNWLSIHANYTWRECSNRVERLQAPYRQQWVHVRCYLVRKEHCNEVYAHLLKQCFWGSGLSDAGYIDDVFLGEYPWAEACNDMDDDWNWMHEFRGLRHPIAITAARYSAIADNDCSIDNGFGALLPSPLLVNSAGLEWSRDGFSFVDAAGDVVVFDPSAGRPCGDSLLIREDFALKFLAQGQYDLIWALVGKRELFGLDHGQRANKELSISGAYRMKNGKLIGHLTEYATSYGNVNCYDKDQPIRILHKLT